MEKMLDVPQNRPRPNPLRSIAVFLLIALFFAHLLPDAGAPDANAPQATATPAD